jgi:hypothetical protein
MKRLLRFDDGDDLAALAREARRSRGEPPVIIRLRAEEVAELLKAGRQVRDSGLPARTLLTGMSLAGFVAFPAQAQLAVRPAEPVPVLTAVGSSPSTAAAPGPPAAEALQGEASTETFQPAGEVESQPAATTQELQNTGPTPEAAQAPVAEQAAAAPPPGPPDPAAAATAAAASEAAAQAQAQAQAQALAVPTPAPAPGVSMAAAPPPPEVPVAASPADPPKLIAPGPPPESPVGKPESKPPVEESRAAPVPSASVAKPAARPAVIEPDPNVIVHPDGTFSQLHPSTADHPSTATQSSQANATGWCAEVAAHDGPGGSIVVCPQSKGPKVWGGTGGGTGAGVSLYYDPNPPSAAPRVVAKAEGGAGLLSAGKSGEVDTTGKVSLTDSVGVGPASVGVETVPGASHVVGEYDPTYDFRSRSVTPRTPFRLGGQAYVDTRTPITGVRVPTPVTTYFTEPNVPTRNWIWHFLWR